MDLFIQIIGYSFIPVAGIIVFAGIGEIYSGLQEHFKAQPLKFAESFKIGSKAIITERPFVANDPIRLQIPAV